MNVRSIAVAALTVYLAGLVSMRATAQTTDEIDWNKARQLHQRVVRGEKLTEEEQAYHDRAAKALRSKGGRDRQPSDRQASAPAKPPVELKPLTDLGAEDDYQGQDGGLYGGGKNTPPEAHQEAAMEQARLIRPLDADGKPAEDGKIGFISVGMSNTTQEFSVFLRMANEDPAKSPRVVIVDGAQGGMEALAWAESADQPQDAARNPWTVLAQRLERAGVSPKQVQVAWIKQARRNPASLGEFPKHAEEMKAHMVKVLNELRERFPNLRIAYLSSRIYAGYAKTPLNPEPYAYESAFVVRWLIQDQVQGDPALNYNADRGAVRSPLLLWGPYLWADGLNGRKIDGLKWSPEDLGGDGTHPSDSGRRKVAELLLEFVKTDPTAKLWFVR